MSSRAYVFDDYAATSLEPVMRFEVARTARYEQQLTALERDLDLELKKAREKVILYKEKKELVTAHIGLAKQEIEVHVPKMLRALNTSLEMIHEVEWRLSGIRLQLAEIRNVYNLGRSRAKALQADMEWKAKSDFEQWRSTLLGKSPLCTRQVKREWLRLLWRLLLAIALFLFIIMSRAAIRRS